MITTARKTLKVTQRKTRRETNLLETGGEGLDLVLVFFFALVGLSDLNASDDDERVSKKIWQRQNNKSHEIVSREIGKYSGEVFIKFSSSVGALDHARSYLFFWDFQGFQVVAYDTEFFFKFNNLTVKGREREICRIRIIIQWQFSV